MTRHSAPRLKPNGDSGSVVRTACAETLPACSQKQLSATGWQWRCWVDLNVDIYQKSSWGSGGRHEPLSGVRGSAPENFEVYGFCRRHLWRPILANFKQSFRCFVAEVFSKWTISLCWICNRCGIVFCLVLCVFGRDVTETLPESHVSCPQIRRPLTSATAVFTQRRPCSCWATSGLAFSSTWTKVLHFLTTVPWTGVPPALNES